MTDTFLILFFPNLLSPCVLVSRSRAIFNSISLEDLGTFSCVVTNTDGISSSYTLTEEGESAQSLGISASVRLKLYSLEISLVTLGASGAPVCYTVSTAVSDQTLLHPGFI